VKYSNLHVEISKNLLSTILPRLGVEGSNRRCCTYKAMQEGAIFDATADLQQEVGERLKKNLIQYFTLPSCDNPISSPSQISILIAQTQLIAIFNY